MTKTRGIVLVLHNIRSIFNVGSIFRTADAAGVSHLYLCGTTPTPAQHAEKMAKTALGAEKTVPWEYQSQSWRVLQQLQLAGYRNVALEQAEKAINIFKYKVGAKQVALLVGNEVRGLSPQILSYCDEVLEIPMYGKKESLNVSVATGVALYALVNKK